MTEERVVRHSLPDRLFHWITALSVLTLLGTGLLPVLGIQFSWVTIHWIAGVILTLAILFHIIRALFWQDLGSMWINTHDIRTAVDSLNPGRPSKLKPGKYSFAQKSIHLAFTLFSMVAVGTGLVMMVKIDTPFWTRDPYWLDSATWGWIYVAHGVSALVFVTMVMMHIYFALRPEKLMYTRSMIRGWITREEYTDSHDTERWKSQEPPAEQH